MAFEAHILEQGDVRAEVVPERGAIVATLRVAGREVLYLERGSLDDPTKNVRGGIPLLFPMASRLPDDLLVVTGTKMKQHGFGRNKAWRVTEKRTGVLRMALEQDADTAAQFPFAYDAEHSVVLVPRGLQVELLVHNRDKRPLPLSPGWHPYYNCPADKKKEAKGDIDGLVAGLLTNEREFDFGLPAPINGRVPFEMPGLGKLVISFSPEMRHFQFWAPPGKDLICLEPFYGPPNAINTPDRMEVPPGRARLLWMRIELL